jgi:tetratricopeptide (TPR) repeat protein
MLFQGIALKKTTGRGLLFCALLLFMAGMPARADEAVPVTVDKQGAVTRIVLGFPKLVGYHAVKSGDEIRMDFNTPLDLQKPSALPPAVTSFTPAKPDATTLNLSIGLRPGEDFKHYRQLRKIVIEISPAAAAAPPPEKMAKKEEKKAEKPVVAAPPPAPEKKAEAVPEVKKSEVKKPEVKKEDKPVALAPQPAAAPVAPVAAESVPAEPTKITLSTVSPTRIAVFQRFGSLWIVADGQVSNAFAPEVDGPQVGVLGKPKSFKFGEGRAWRYPMPADSFISVQKKNLAWNIFISPQSAPRPAAAAASVDVDHASGKAKLMAQLPGAGDAIAFEDPYAGDTLYVVATNQENMRVEEARRFVDEEVLPADMGFVLRPLKGGLTVNRLNDYVLVTAPDGIITSSDVVSSVAATDTDDSAEEPEDNLLYDFPAWRQGGMKELYRNVHAMQEKISEAKTPEERQSLLMKLAYLYFANNFGQEALGVLRIIGDENEDMAKTPDFVAIQGAANAMAGHYQEALQYLSDPAIQQHPEVNLWIGYAAAATEQWHKASASFPKSNRILVKYPDNIAIPFTLYMAESALRLGRTDTAIALLGSVSTASEDFSPQYKSAIGYLRGEAFRQKNHIDDAVAAWQPVAKGIDRLYHTKASLALANLMLQQKKVTLKEAIDQVDSLRFAWRGDGLEVQILQNLGALKVQDGQYLSGLEDMKEAATLSDSLLDDATPIRDGIRRVFTDLFVGGQAEKIPPLEAVSLYQEFSSLLPPGQDSATASLHFADYLVRMDLLEKAEKIFEDNLKSGVAPDGQVAPMGAKLAAVYLLDAKPSLALAALDETARGGVDDKQREERVLLRARAQSQLGRTDDAISTLAAAGSKDAQKLKVDVLWHAKRWAAAAAAIEPMLPPPSAKLDDDGAKLVLNMAVASKLAGNTAALDALKTRYAAAMSATPLASTFGVVTRDGGLSSLADRDTLLKMSGEVDMFKGFLDSYKAGAAAKVGG